MATLTDQFGIQEALTKLGIQEVNKGSSTGSEFFANGEIIESYSPVDGSLIAKVQASTKEDYEKAMEKAHQKASDNIDSIKEAMEDYEMSINKMENQD